MLNSKFIPLIFVLITINVSTGIRLDSHKMSASANAEGAPGPAAPAAQPMPAGAPAPGATLPNPAAPPNPAAANQAMACTGPDCPLKFATVNQAGGGGPALPTAMPR